MTPSLSRGPASTDPCRRRIIDANTVRRRHVPRISARAALVERGENVVGAFVYEEDPHESPKFVEPIVPYLFASRGVWCKATRGLRQGELADVTNRLQPDVIFCLGWRTLIPPGILAAAPRRGHCRSRFPAAAAAGFAPTNWAMILGHDRLARRYFN